MAVIKLSALVSEVSGKLNGSTFANDKSILVLRTNPNNIKKHSARVTTQNSNFYAVVKAWSATSDFRRSQWENIENDGLSGFDLFVRTNLRRRNTGSAISLPPPIFRALPLFQPLSITSASLGGIMTQLRAFFVPMPSVSGFTILAYASPPLPASVSNFKKHMRRISVVFNLATGTFNMFSAYVQTWGNVGSGQRIGFKFVLADNASQVRSPAFFLSVIVP